ncbi:c-type cytochrome [Ohtaekwangia kribbensis]|jgi:cytochrome c551|uniref:C-type cytochrome n=1 Tax=Ohtaekwangia kribbensis TaxID=688913 RepID=A0ABW3K0M6_9BACT
MPSKLAAESVKMKIQYISIALGILLLAFCFQYCSGKKSDSNISVASSVKQQQYYVHGEQLYIKHCSNCHQKNGTGLGLLYPPLAKSDYVDTNFESVICLMRYGMEGELTVNGKSFNKAMPGIPSLSDLEIAEIATYLYNTWEHQRDSIELQDVSRILDNCKEGSVSK